MPPRYTYSLSVFAILYSSISILGCAESNSINGLSASVQMNQDAARFSDLSVRDSEPSMLTDMATDMTTDMRTSDLYIPPPPVDMAVDMSEPVELTLRRCVQRMLDYLEATRAAAGCNDFPNPERADPSSPYTRDPIAAACIQLECTGLPLDGHNGIPTTKSCLGIDNLMATLEVAEEDANNGTCGTPVFQVKVIPLDLFAGPEACDALICGLEADGNVIAVDQRN